MFNKLVSNLNFNPGLINQVGFYANRLRQETALRRLSFVFIALAMVIQTFAVMSPPQKSLAASSNHIFDGLRSSNSVRTNVNLLVGAWDNTDIKDIYGYFGVTKQDIATIANTQTTHRRISSCDGQDWWTTGRNSLSGYSKVSSIYKNTQVAVEYSPGRYIYQRQLKAWDIINSCNYYYALQGTIASTGKTFYILLDCGNFTTVGRYVPPPPPTPTPTIGAVCRLAGPIKVKENDTEATIPVTVTLADGKTIPAGSEAVGLHLGVTYIGANKNWNVSDPTAIAAEPKIPPDQQGVFTPVANDTSGLNYYQFTWGYDGKVYRRYYIPSQQSGTFTVNVRVKLNRDDKRIAIRLLDRGKGQWLQHNSACEAAIQREVPEKCPYNSALPKGDPRCKPCPYDGLGDLWIDDASCKEEPIPEPALDIRKTIIDKKTSYLPGDELTYLIEYRNTVNGSNAENVVIKDELNSAYVEIASVNPSIADKGLGKIELSHTNLGYSATFRSITVRVKVKGDLKSGDTYCNVSSISAKNAPTDTERECFTVIVPCRYDPSVPDDRDENCTQPVVSCEVTNGIFDETNYKARFTTTAVSTNQDNTQITGYVYDFGDNQTLTNASSAYTDTAEHTYEAGQYDMSVSVTYRITGQEESEDRSATCEDEVRFDAPLTEEKTVVNLTQNKDEAQTLGAKVQPKDVLLYTLITRNSLNYEKTGVTIKDYVGDITEYANIDLEYLKQQGGAYDENTKTIVWENVTVPAASSMSHTFKVTMKDTIPATNSPSALGTAYDCEISNEYGNEVSLQVACPLVKGIETLPNTGPGASMAGGMGITLVVGYFYARSRLLRKELAIIRNDFTMSGGV